MSDPTVIPNSFSTYNLTEEQEMQGSILSLEQRCCIGNEIAFIAQQILNLEYDVSNPTSFIQQEAGLKGQLEALNFILDKSLAAQTTLLELNS